VLEFGSFLAFFWTRFSPLAKSKSGKPDCRVGRPDEHMVGLLPILCDKGLVCVEICFKLCYTFCIAVSILLPGWQQQKAW